MKLETGLMLTLATMLVGAGLYIGRLESRVSVLDRDLSRLWGMVESIQAEVSDLKH